MQQQKKQRDRKHCPHHGNTELRRRRGAWTHKWMWYCPNTGCNYTEYETSAAKA